MDIKKKFSSVVDHVKAHRTPYTIVATATVSIGVVVYLEKKFLDSKQLVNLTSNAERMRETGKGVYFDLKDGSGTVAMILEEFLDKPLNRLS